VTSEGGSRALIRSAVGGLFEQLRAHFTDFRSSSPTSTRWPPNIVEHPRTSGARQRGAGDADRDARPRREGSLARYEVNVLFDPAPARARP